MGVRKTLLLVFILCLAAILRLILLSSIPPALSWDEAAIGYNAWSILKTGQDEYGQAYPLLFRSFEDYKLPGMVYLVALSEAVFGLNAWAVRLPSALLGVLTVFAFYLMVGEMFRRSPQKNIYQLAGAFLLSINPWQINFSRQCFESNACVFWVVMGIWLLFRGLRFPKNYLLSAFFLSLSFYFYYSVRLLVVALLLVFIRVYSKNIIRQWRWLLLAGLIGLLTLLPILPSILSTGGFSRIGQVNIFHEPNYIARMDAYSKTIARYQGAAWAKIIFNRRWAFLEAATSNFFKNYSLEHLFISGTVFSGLLYLWELPFFILGAYLLLRQKGQSKWLIIAWFLIGTLSSALTTNQPNALRTLVALPAFVFISTLGIVKFLKSRLWQIKLLQLTTALVVIIFLVRFLFLYFLVIPQTRAQDFGDGYPQLSAYLAEKQADYNTIWVTGERWRPYIHLLFYWQYEPSLYQKNGSPEGFANLQFGRASWDKEGVYLGAAKLSELVKGKTLFILTPEEFQAQIAQNLGFRSAQPIDGRYTPSVFLAIEL